MVVASIVLVGCGSGAPTEKDISNIVIEKQQKNPYLGKKELKTLKVEIEDLKCQDRDEKIEGSDSYICDFKMAMSFEMFGDKVDNNESVKGLVLYKVNDRWAVAKK